MTVRRSTHRKSGRAATAKKFLAASSVGIAVAVGGGCSGETPDYDHPAYAVVVDLHRNSPTATRLPEVIDNAAAERGKVTLILVDGQPHVVAEESFDVQGDNDVVQFEINNRKNALLDAFREAAPNDPEADVMAAIELARRVVSGAPTDTKAVFADTSGLSTRGTLNYLVPGSLYAAPTEVVQHLGDTGNAPGDAHGINLEFRGLGDSAAPQPELTPPMKRNLIETYRAVWESAGAAVTIDETPRADPDLMQWPPVTPSVSEIPIVADWVPSTEPTQLPAQEFFEPGSSTLIDRGHTRELLQPFADAARRPGGGLFLEGRTARDGDRDYQLKLGAARAEALKQVLVDDLGIPADRISTSSVGSYGPSYRPDIDEHGNLIPEIAAMNRNVLIVVVGSTR